MKKAWEFLSGKKTVIAALCGLALSWVQARGFLSADDAMYLSTALTVLTGVALGHKAVKVYNDENR